MPGPVSDGYDPEFGTAANAHDVAEAVKFVRDRVSARLSNSELRNIVDVVHPDHGAMLNLQISERNLRVMRFALNRALESL